MFFSTILEALTHHALETPDKAVFTWVYIKCEEQNKMTFKQLQDESNAVAARLLKLGSQKGDHVMIAYPFGLEFLAGMVGAMKVGVIPCSIYPPNPNQLKTDMPKFRRFAEDAGAKYALSTGAFATAMTAADYEKFAGEPEDICLIQYTSGSTGRPKGVMISHHNLAENCRAVGIMANVDSSTVAALWVPQYHDMGLVAGVMTTLYTGVHLVLASPLDFIVNPLLWTDMVERYQANLTCAPNFAYALLLKRLEQANRKADWSCVKCAGFSAEPTQQCVVEDVIKTLSIHPEHVYNIYGLAESVVFLTGGCAYPDSEGLVSCGEVDSSSVKLRIVEAGKEVEEGQVGSIWAQSPRVAVGYFGQPELTTAMFKNTLSGYEGTWLDTGDLGKVVDGQLYVTGRVKDVIIVNGKNYYPSDVELSIDDLFGDVIRPGRTTAFQHGDASVGITVEGRKDFDKSENESFAFQRANHVSQVHGLLASAVVVLKLGVTPKTTSGKLKRSEIRQITIAGGWKKSSMILQFKRQGNSVPMIGVNNTVLAKATFGGLPGSTDEAQARNPDPNVDCAVAASGATNRDDFSTGYGDILMSVLEAYIDTSKTWAENGLTSLASAELRNQVEEKLHVVLPVNFEQLYPTPNALSLFLSASKSTSFPIEEACNHCKLWNFPRSRLSQPHLGILQTLGSVMILLLFLGSILPSYFLVSWVMDHCESSKVGECNSPFVWLLLPLSFPLYLISFSIIVVFCKYAVVGTYLHRQIEILSWGYLQWWFVDRLLEVWEYFVGQFIVETKFIWIFYWLLGADLAWSTRIESFLREFDLVTIGENAVISHPIKCRKFSKSTETGLTVTFRPIFVGKSCQVSGMVSPGASIGDDSKVEKLSVVEEGAQVPDGVLARGNPACHAGSFEPSKSRHWEENLLNAFKIVWLFLEAYQYFALSFLVHTTLNKILPSIALKWLLIGKRNPSEDYAGSLYRRATLWACDFHFRVAARTLTPFIGVTKLWHVILFLHGLDVDLESRLNNPYRIFLPSKVDFIKIRKSFVATISLDFRKQSTSKFEIVNSSIGYGVNLHAGVKIVQSSIPPRLDVSGDVYDLNTSGRASQPSIFMDFVLPEVTQIFLAVVLFVSLIPSYELGRACMNNATTGVAMFGLLMAVLLQLFLWLLSSRVFESIQLNLPTGVQESTIGAYVANVWFFRVQNVLELLLAGTPMFTYYAHIMGAEVNGDFWYFGNAIYEYSNLHIHGSTIVDSSSLNGHYIDGNGLTIDDTHISGVLHPGCFAVAGSKASGESGPWKVILGRGGAPASSADFGEVTRSKSMKGDPEVNV
ncbi:7a-methyl-1,5-dioxo-octahydro-1H-inden-4-yl [Seminavis robusta]|uniref:7a-methyl-1,5-dioxo-octahydro-1H-inden-4-yl n=1 Tax=Seminavis robusta TaxID=568900 RepID=A0A9N8ESV0_9STRA|nr:7a-methyl-1,5-dioxo-octahydro-1H-inden-4-yl [Seminavis robusta]|eukprot:Sro1674_g290370.1 7a-methyl-1,5-dioxo-octahydro-1H-inden-4-yl (1317) ;mRNA; r:15851-20324